MSCAVVAFGALSALGEGRDALGLGDVGEPARLAVTRDAELAAASLTRPFCGRVREIDAVERDADRATLLLERALLMCATQLDASLPDWRKLRVGLAIGTSSGGMRSFERAFRTGGSRFCSTDATYLGPVLATSRPCDFQPMALLLGACASSTLAIGVAREWLLAGACDVALCGGFDAVSVFVASGFEALRAVCTYGAPSPFRVGRDGLALGEGAAVLALIRGGDADRSAQPVHGYVQGFAASCDAVHLTAPCREGRGLARAAAGAINEAGRPVVDLVSAHGTGTLFNDASEMRALSAVLGSRLAHVPLHALKSQTGHTLGSGGALEALAALQAMKRGVAPASAGAGALEVGVHLLEQAEACSAATALKLSAAFGGANAALLLTRDEPSPSRARPIRDRCRAVYISSAAAVTEPPDSRFLASVTGYAEDKIARGGGLVRLALAAVERLRASLLQTPDFALKGAGIIVGHGLATVDMNEVYLARIGALGATRAEPRRFPYTTPNAVAGECAVAFGLTGPAFAVGGGPLGGLDALAMAADLVRGGVAERIVVVAVDEGGATSRKMAPGTAPGAVALLVAASPLAARLEAWSTGLPAQLPPGGTLDLPYAVEAHRVLLPLASGRPETLEVKSPWGGFAKARFFWL